MFRNYQKRIIAAFLAFAVVFVFSTVSLAGELFSSSDPALILREQNGTASFVTNLPVGEPLFADFSAVMPGDVFEQSITIRSDSANRSSYNIYLYARVCDQPGANGHGAGTSLRKEGFLDFFLLKINNGGLLSHNAAITSATSANGMLLGRLSPGQSAEFNITLEIDVAMGNDMQNATDFVDWVFFAQEISSPADPEPSGPPTSDRIIGGGGQGPNEPSPTTAPGTQPIPTEEEEIDIPPIPTDELPPTEEELETGGLPLTDLPRTGDRNLFFQIVMTVFSGCGLVCVVVFGRKRKPQA